MAPESGRRDSQGMVSHDDERPFLQLSMAERLVRLEERLIESREDRRKLHERLDEAEKNISDQIKVQTERSAYMDILKWVAALILTSVGGYFFAVLTQHVDKNTAAIDQHMQAPEHPK